MTDIAHDAELVARARDDPQAFGELYERYVKKIYSYLYYRTGNTHDAEDLTERVFQKAMVNLHRYTSRGLPFSAWLYRIAHNLLANWHRDQGRRQTVAFNELAPGEQAGPRSETPELLVEEGQEREALLRAIRRMPEERQQVIFLKFVQEMSNVEIGQVMQRSEGAVKSLYHRTLLALRDELSKPRAPNGGSRASGGPHKE